jgi:peroxiredoxin
MKNKVMAVLVSLFCVVSLCFAQGAKGVKVKKGEAMPNIAAMGIEGKAYSVKTVSSIPNTKGVLVVVFASWCKACLDEIKQLIKAKKQLDQKGIRVLLVNAMEEDFDKLDQILKELDLHGFYLIVDKSGYIADDQLGLVGKEKRDSRLPFSCVLDSQGVIKEIIYDPEEDFVQQVLRVYGR